MIVIEITCVCGDGNRQSRPDHICLAFLQVLTLDRACFTACHYHCPVCDSAEAANPSQTRVQRKTGAYPKINSRCASVGAAVLLRFQLPLFRRPDSGSNTLMVGRYPRFRLRFFASVSNPHLVQSPDDLRPTDPFGLAPSLTSHSPIIDREIIFLFSRKTNWSSRPSSGSRAVRRVIADWSLVRPFAFR